MNVIYSHINFEDLKHVGNFWSNGYVYSEMPGYYEISKKSCIDNGASAVTLIEADVYKMKKFYDLCGSKFSHKRDDAFWFSTIYRLVQVFDFVCENKIEEFVHLEYDNLVYHDLNILSRLPNGNYFTQVGETFGSAGFCYFKGNDEIKKIKDFLYACIVQGHPCSNSSDMDMIHLGVFMKAGKYLPLFPWDDYYQCLGKVFDGASYGQYIGGTNNGHSEGWFGEHHKVGKLIKTGDVKPSFEGNIPTIETLNKRIEIFNLHIHSKKLEKFYNQ